MDNISSKKTPFEIIDFHIHPFLKSKHNVCFYEKTVDNLEDINSDLIHAGISKACGSVIDHISYESFVDIRRLNDESILIEEKLGGLYIPGVHIHPKFVEESCQELKRMHQKGVRLVGELVPYFMGWENYYDKSLHEIYECIEQLGMVVSVHTQSEDTLEQAVKTFPGITFVAAHPGDKNSYLRHLERMNKYENYYLDLSGTGIFRYGLIGYGVNKVGSERFLFGNAKRILKLS